MTTTIRVHLHVTDEKETPSKFVRSEYGWSCWPDATVYAATADVVHKEQCLADVAANARRVHGDCVFAVSEM